jgi:carboxyl-terminal processing protease
MTKNLRLLLNRSKRFLMAVIIGLASGILLDRQVLLRTNPPLGIPAEAREEFALMAEAWGHIERRYVNQDGVEPRSMAHSSIRGMVQTLDDFGHTRFLTPEMAQRHANQIQGQFEGIGAYVEAEDGRVIIVAPIDNSPAQRAGLEVGDVVVGVNGEDATQLSPGEVVNRILGPAGTEVTLTILDPDTGNTREVTLERAELDIDLVTWARLPGTDVAHVRVSSFSDGATEELRQTLDEIQAQEVGGAILDLRSNPGGLLREAIGAASQFIESGDVLIRRDAQGATETVPVKEDVDAVDMPLVVLINSGTASAAEIVTGALQDYDRATIVGTTTAGAGTVLNAFPLNDGSMLLLAVEEWLTPDGRQIWQKGLAPDETVSLPADTTPLLRSSQRDLTEEALQKSGDTQLLRALEILGGQQ